MQGYVVNRPDPAAMERILQRNPDNAAGAILRLAWQAGLLREEIRRLTWDQVDFQDGQLLLPDRTVPIPAELSAWLRLLRESRNRSSETVVLSDRDQKPLTAQSISRLARTALDTEGQTEVRLIDLRHDFVLRQLETKDWQQVSRITGIEAAAMKTHFAAYLEKGVSTRAVRAGAPILDEFALWKLLQAERGTPAGAALWLTWQLGLRLEEIVALTWNQVDFERERLCLPDRQVPLTSGVLGVLKNLRAAAPGSAYVVTAPRSGRPYDRTRLSKLVRTVLVKAGLDNVTLRDLRLDCDIRVGGENAVTAYLRRHASITRNQAAELLELPPSTAYKRLKQMARRGKLTQIGGHYYLSAAVVPPEQQAETILRYLNREGFAYRQDIARLLRIDPRQCRVILQQMVEAGQILQQRQRYVLKKQA